MPKSRSRRIGFAPPNQQPLTLNRASPQAVGLWAAWPLLATHSVKVQREVVRGFVATVEGGTQWRADPVRGQAPWFNRVNGSWLGNTTMVFPYPGPITVMYWTRVMSGEVGESSAFSVGNGAAGTSDEVQAHCPWSDSNLYWDCGGTGAGQRISTSFASYLNKWTHVALVSTGAGGNFQAIYLDGRLITSAGSSSGPAAPRAGVYIGGWQAGARAHTGLISDFRVYNVVVPLATIQAAASFETAYDLYQIAGRVGMVPTAPPAATARSFAVIVG